MEGEFTLQNGRQRSNNGVSPSTKKAFRFTGLRAFRRVQKNERASLEGGSVESRYEEARTPKESQKFTLQTSLSAYLALSMRKPNAKERILETAGALFFQRGYSEVGINEIIEKAGTAKASFYQHFPSKESLCEAWLKSIHEFSETFRRELLEGSEAPMAKLERYFDQLEAFMINSQFRGCPYSNTSAVSGEQCCGIIEQIKSHKESIRKFFHTLSAQQIPDTARATAIGDRIFVLYSGATGEAQNLKAIWPVQVARAAAIEMLQN